MVMQRETELRMQRESEQNKKDAILERLSSDMAKAQREADELENLRNELVVQETEERIIQKEKEKFERTVQQRLDIALANEYQRQLKSIRREEEKKEEDEFRLAMMKKFEEDDRLDELNARKRREKQMEHRREIERLLEKRREAYEAERARPRGEGARGAPRRAAHADHRGGAPADDRQPREEPRPPAPPPRHPRERRRPRALQGERGVQARRYLRGAYLRVEHSGREKAAGWRGEGAQAAISAGDPADPNAEIG